MSDFGRHWSLKVRGCTIAEHAILNRLGDRYHVKTGRCYPGRDGLSFELEASKIYITQLFQSLERKKFILRVARFEPRLNKQTSNEFRLNFDRWFPFVSDEIEREEKRLLGYFRRAVESPELAQGFMSAWLERAYYRDPGKGKAGANKFRSQGGKSVRRKPDRPVSDCVWVAVQSEGHERHLLFHLPDIAKQIKADTGHEFSLKILRTWLKKPDQAEI